MKKSSKTTKGQLELFKADDTKTDPPKVKTQKPEPKIVRVVDKSGTEDFERIFHQNTKKEWAIIWNNNRSVMISYSVNRKPPVLRIQQAFTKAPDEVVVEIAKMVESKRKRKWPKIVNLFVSKAQNDIFDTRKPSNKTVLEAKGEVFDLNPLFDKINKKHFDNEIKSRLGWMNIRTQRRVTIKLGSFSEETDVIRLHPALDNKKVPQYVIESILHHEMTHARVKSQKINGRRIVHGEDFYQELANFPEHDKADKWIKQNMGSLLPKRKQRKSRKK